MKTFHSSKTHNEKESVAEETKLLNLVIFSQTQLYAAIQNWEKANEAFVVLRAYLETRESVLD